jgi:ornithine cyclodeaminase
VRRPGSPARAVDRGGRLADDAAVLILSRADVEALLDPLALIDALAGAMADLTAGRASVPNRIAAFVEPSNGLLAAMPAYAPTAGALAAKLVSVFPENAGTPLPSHQALIVVCDPSTGRPDALMDGTAITALRTGAGSALSVRLLARADAKVLAILGTGVQARSHAATVPLVHEFREVRVAGRNPEAVDRLVQELAGQGLPARGASSWEEALAGADVACATTHALDPVVRREWLSAGTHVTSVGFDVNGREVDDATVRDARIVVESRAAALAPAPAGSNDLVQPMAAGLIDESDVTEIGEILSGIREGRSSDDEITLYKSVGVGVQDAAAAALVLAAARERGVGSEFAM